MSVSVHLTQRWCSRWCQGFRSWSVPVRLLVQIPTHCCTIIYTLVFPWVRPVGSSFWSQKTTEEALWGLAMISREDFPPFYTINLPFGLQCPGDSMQFGSKAVLCDYQVKLTQIWYCFQMTPKTLLFVFLDWKPIRGHMTWMPWPISSSQAPGSTIPLDYILL